MENLITIEELLLHKERSKPVDMSSVNKKLKWAVENDCRFVTISASTITNDQLEILRQNNYKVSYNPDGFYIVSGWTQ